MRRCLVTGATGFIGNHLIKRLLADGYSVTATGRSIEKARKYSWFNNVDFIEFDINSDFLDKNLFDYFNSPDFLIHLAWEGLPNYDKLFHLENNFFKNYLFVKNLVSNGLKDLTITGTCLEYGLQNGELHEDLISLPQNVYSISKDFFRKSVELLEKDFRFSFKWVRLFYMYGEGQNPKSILSLLMKSISKNEQVFKMSGGEQLRDYLPVEIVAEYLMLIASQKEVTGIINCCSGNPISIRKLVESHIKKIDCNIRLELGYYPYPDYEPLAFWGSIDKLNKIIL